MPLTNLLAGRTLELLGWSLVHFVWQGVVLALVLTVVLRLLRCKSAQTRYVAGCAALALMAACPLATIGWLAQQEQTTERDGVLAVA